MLRLAEMPQEGHVAGLRTPSPNSDGPPQAGRTAVRTTALQPTHMQGTFVPLPL